MFVGTRETATLCEENIYRYEGNSCLYVYGVIGKKYA
jgi:hypothetical protein